VQEKIRFDLAGIDAEGLTGPPGGRRAVRYEFCIPRDEMRRQEIETIDPSVAVSTSPGRIGCTDGEFLCIGSTNQPNWKAVLFTLADLEYVREIRESQAE
jgi:hypothetical protein